MSDKTNVRYVIVEDEPHARAVLVMHMARHPEFELVGEASSPEEASDLIKTTSPDLILLDIMLGDATAFDLLTGTDIGKANLIFTTSHEDHALKAIKVSALDYLLKPIAAGDIDGALEKFKSTMSRGEQRDVRPQLKIAGEYHAGEREMAQLALPTLHGFNFVYVKDIVRCESDNTYTTFHFVNQKPLIVSRTLKEWEGLLTEYNFFRVHNSHLVNKRHIVEYKKGEGGLVVMSDNSHVDVSRRKKEEFMAFIMGGH
jgi:two-component system LytT family response regulator